MGYNICGFITDQSFNLIQPKLESVLGVHFEKEEIVTLSEALSEKFGDLFLDVYEKKGVTMLFCDNILIPDEPKFSSLTQSGSSLVEFMLNDTSNVYAFRFYKNGQITDQEFYTFEPSFICHGKNLLNLSEKDDIVERGISHIIHPLIGARFEDLKTSDKALRVHFSLNR